MTQALKIVTIVNGRELKGKEAERVRIEASYSISAGNIIDTQNWEIQRERYKPLEVEDRCSVKRAMIAVETKLVEALWTLARLPGDSSIGSCGIAYVEEASDRWANAVEKGWEQAMPSPARPSGRAIDEMHIPLEWLSLLPRDQSMFVSVAAGTKKGDVKRNVRWNRVRSSLPHVTGQTVRTLQRRYEGGIRQIVARLTEKALGESV